MNDVTMNEAFMNELTTASLTSSLKAKPKKRNFSEVYSPGSDFLRLDRYTFAHILSEDWWLIRPGHEEFDVDEPSLVRRYFEAEYTIAFDPPEQVWYDDVYPLSHIETLCPGISAAIDTFEQLGPAWADMKAYIHSCLQGITFSDTTSLDLPILSAVDCPA
jgi:hypothetical protein